LLTGTTEEEFRFFVVPSGVAAMTTEEALESYLSTVGAPPETLGVYRGNRPDATAGDVLAAIITDRFFRLPCLTAVEARPAGASWVYEFGWASAHKALGAAHAMDLPFVFDALGAEGVTGLTGPDAPQKLGDAMHRTWVEFATTGDPGWQPYDGQRTVMVFDADGSHETQAPREDERAVWTAGA